MNWAELQEMTSEQLVGRFTTLALAQDQALLMDDIAEVNRLYRQLKKVESELKARDGDQRRTLLSLYDHPSAQVRVKAVKATLAVAATEARRQLQIIADSREYPQAAEAGMSIRNLDQGIYKPT